MRKFFFLLPAPILALIAWGAAVAAHPEAALDYFPYFFIATVLAVVAAIVAVFLWMMGYGKRAEWEDAGLHDEGAHGHP